MNQGHTWLNNDLLRGPIAQEKQDKNQHSEKNLLLAIPLHVVQEKARRKKIHIYKK